MPVSRRTFLHTSSAAIVAGIARPLHGQQVSTAAQNQSTLALNLEMWLGDMSFPDRIRAASDFGFSHFEFWPWRGKDLDAIEVAMSESGMSATQFTAWGFSPGMNDPKNLGAVLKEIEASCIVAKRLGAPMMTVVGGNDQPGMTASEMHQNITEALKRAAPIAAQHEVMLILEPMNIRRDHKGHCLYGSTDALRICREVDSPWVKINWDLYHMQISEGDLCGHLREGYDQIGYVQLADHPGRREPGTGEIHYARVLRELWDLGYRKPIGVECYPSETALKSIERLLQNTAF